MSTVYAIIISNFVSYVSSIHFSQLLFETQLFFQSYTPLGWMRDVCSSGQRDRPWLASPNAFHSRMNFAACSCVKSPFSWN